MISRVQTEILFLYCLRSLSFSLVSGVFLLFTCSSPLYADDASSDPRSLSLSGINVSARVILQGAYDATTGLMRSDLQTRGLLPVDQPYNSEPFAYSGMEQLDTAVAAAIGQDAVVDWVLIELRAPAKPFHVVKRQAAVIQRDGDVVDPATGAVVTNFPSVEAGEYRLAIRHRNHYEVMSGESLSLGLEVVLMDFTRPDTLVEGEHARLSQPPFELMRAGDSNQDQQIIAAGFGNDIGPIINIVLLNENNEGSNASYIVEGYLSGDLNMDGRVIYVGPGNDASPILFNVLTHPLNSNGVENFIVSSGT